MVKDTNGDPSHIPAALDAQAHLSPVSLAKEDKTAEELAEMIGNDLGMIEGCPTRGVKVTVYGLNPWNCMLSFGIDAGPVPNKADLQAFCDVITERLKRLYNIKT